MMPNESRDEQVSVLVTLSRALTVCAVLAAVVSLCGIAFLLRYLLTAG